MEEPACETRGCLSSCDEINDRCFDEMVPQAYLCDEIHCAIARCDNRGRCSYESRRNTLVAPLNAAVSEHLPVPRGACLLWRRVFQRREQPLRGAVHRERGCSSGSAVQTSIGGRPFNHPLQPVRRPLRWNHARPCDGTGADSGSCYPLPDRAGGYLGVCYEGGPRAEGELLGGRLSVASVGRLKVVAREGCGVTAVNVGALQPVATWRFAQRSADALRRHPRG